MNLLHSASGSIRMDALQTFLEDLKRLKLPEKHFLGILHILIGRKVTTSDGALVSAGMTWRELAAVLKKQRWNRDIVKTIGLKIKDLAPRDRERFWYMAISRAGVDSEEAKNEGDKVAELLEKHGYQVGPAPGSN